MMGPGVLAFNGIPSSPIPVDGYLAGPHAWLLLAFGAFALGMLVWMMLAARHERLTQEDVCCPVQARKARVFVRRTRDGRFVGIQACSALSPASPITCSRACRPQIRS